MEYLDYTKTTLDSGVGEHGAIIVTLEQGGTLTLVLTQNAYITGGFDTESYYTALAHDLLDEDEEYNVEWKLRMDHMDDYLKVHGGEGKYEKISYYNFLLELYSGDESNMCDWDNPRRILRY